MKTWPLSGDRPLILPAGHPGSFGFRRRFDVHTGIDLYCEDASLFRAIEAGTIVAVIPFTGPTAGSPWWNDTDAVLIEGESGVILYGEVEPIVEVGEVIEPGEVLGTVKTVLLKDKGRPMTMLHLELYVHGTREPIWWPLDVPQPEGLLDPIVLLF